MSIIVKKGDVNIQNYVKSGAHVRNVYRGPVVFGSGTNVDGGRSDEDFVPSDEQVKAALMAVKGRITHSRLWFAIYRPLVQRKKVANGLFEQFKDYVESLIADLPRPIDPHDLKSKMDVLSFRKNVEDWDPSDAPVAGKSFMTYYNLGIDFLNLISDPVEDDEEEDDED